MFGVQMLVDTSAAAHKHLLLIHTHMLHHRWSLAFFDSLALPERRSQGTAAGSTHREKWRYSFQSLSHLQEFISPYFKDADDRILKRYRDYSWQQMATLMTLGLLTEYDSHVWWFWRLQEQSLPPHTQSVSVQTLVTRSAQDTNIRVFMGNWSLHFEVADVWERRVERGAAHLEETGSWTGFWSPAV